MIAAWMLYTLGVSLLLYASARAAESVAHALRLPARWVWFGALTASVALSTLALVRGIDPPRRIVSDRAPLGMKQLEPVVVTILPSSAPARAPQAPMKLAIHNILTDARNAVERIWGSLYALDVAALDRWNVPLICGWVGASSIVLVFLAIALIRLRGLERTFSRRIIGGETVFVSDNIGPAVFGVFTPRIVIPAWIFGLPHASRSKIYEHERTHVDANDPALLCVGRLAVALQPWNVALWPMLTRLGSAIETDCDQRVVGNDARTIDEYARLIISVYERATRYGAPYMAFASRRSNLETRLRQMMHHRRRSPSLVIVSGSATVALAAMAWTMNAADLRAPERAKKAAHAERRTHEINHATPATPRSNGRAYGLALVDSTIRPTNSTKATPHPGIDRDTLWEAPMSSRCTASYPLSPPAEAQFRDSTHLSTTPGYACVVRQGQRLRLVKH